MAIAVNAAIAFGLAAAPAAGAVTAPWVKATPNGGAIEALALAPSMPQVIYAGTAVAGVFRSQDGGVTWAPRNAGLLTADATIVGLAVDPQDPDTVFAVPGAAPGARRLVRSRDGGTTWQPLHLGNPAAVDQIAFDGPRAGTLFASTTNGLYLSTDLGDSWRQLAFGGGPVYAVAADPRRPYVLIAVVENSSFTAAQLWRSTDRGATWQLTALADAALHLPVPDPARPGTFYVLGEQSIFASSDDGASWAALPWSSHEFPLVLAAIPSGVLVVAPASGGAVRSTDGGNTWSPDPEDLAALAPPDQLDTLLASAAAPRALLGGGFTGVWRSADDAASWRPSSRGLAASTPHGVVVAADGTVFCNSAGSILRSRDRGTTWAQVSAGRDANARLIADPADAQGLYLIGSEGNDMYVSHDGGQTWQGIAPFVSPTFLSPSAFALDPGAPADLYVSGITTVGIGHDPEPYTATSRDGGRTWRPLAQALGRPFTLFVVDPTQGSTLYGAMDSGALWRSLDSGRTWTQVGAGLPPFVVEPGPPVVPISALAVDPTDSRRVYVGFAASGVYRSADRGATFIPFNQGLETETVDSLILDASRPGLLFADAGIDGVFRRQATDAAWEPLAGLPLLPGLLAQPPNPGALAFDAHADILYAATASGLYRLADPDRR